MWIKDGQIYTGGGVVIDNKRHWFPTDEQFIAAGFHWEEPKPAPKRYSKLKVIRALGDGWSAKKLLIEAAGLWDQFVAAAWLAEDDLAFAAVLATLTDEEKEMLNTECLYDE